MFELKIEKTKATVEVTVDAKEFNETTQKVYETTKNKYDIVGFRKGHAPRKVIEKTYGDNVFFNDAVDMLMRKTLDDVLEQNPTMEVVDYPKLTINSYTVNDGIKFTIELAIMPEVKIGKYTGLEFKKKSSKATEEEIEHEISHLLEDNAKFDEVDRASKNGDNVEIDFVGSIDGVEFEGGRAEKYPLTLGSHSFIDNFEEQLVGKKKGDKVDVNVTFPKDYQAEEYAGKKALFKVTICSVRERTLPTLDDTFISNATEFNTLEEYRNSVIDNIQSAKQRNAENELEDEMIETIIKNSQIDVPNSLIEHEANHTIENLTEGCKAHNIKVEDYLAMVMNTDLETYTKVCQERAKKNIEARYVFRQILNDQKISATHEEIHQKLDEIAKDKKGQYTQEDHDYAENYVLIDKIYAFLKANNKIIEE